MGEGTALDRIQRFVLSTTSATFARPEPFPGLEDGDWERCAIVLLRSKLGPLFGHIANTGLREAPQWVREALRSAYFFNARRNEHWLGEIASLTQRFEARGIPILARKGIHLADFYPAPGARPFGDIDMLVRPSDRDAALDCLRDAGYAEGHYDFASRSVVPPAVQDAPSPLGLPPMCKAVDGIPELTATQLDLAYSPFAGTVTVDDLPSSWHFDALLERSGRTRGGVPVLGTTDLLVDLATNLYRTSTSVTYVRRRRYQRIIPYVDLLAALTSADDADLDRFEASAHGWLLPPVAFALGNLRRLFPRSLPSRGAERIASSATDEFLDTFGTGVGGSAATIWPVPLISRIFDDVQPPELPANATAEQYWQLI